MKENTKKQANAVKTSDRVGVLSKFMLPKSFGSCLRHSAPKIIVYVVFLSMSVSVMAKKNETHKAASKVSDKKTDKPSQLNQSVAPTSGVESPTLKDKPSLKQFAAPLLAETEITALYRDFYKTVYAENVSAPAGGSAPVSDAELQKKYSLLWNKYSAQLQNLETYFRQQQPFVRGEIEDEKVLGATLKWLQLAMVHCRFSAQQNQWSAVQQHMSAWFSFAADLAYEESSLIGLRVSAVIRALLMDELEKLQAKHAVQIAQSPEMRLWFLQVRAPWPIDRVLVSEAKMRLKPAEIALAESLAQRLQKNPYQSVDKILSEPKMRHSAQTAAADFLRKLWRDEDIQQMKMEINRIGILKIRLAMAEYQARLQKPAVNMTELVQNHFLDQVPTDYFSGKPMDLTSAQKK